MESLLAGLALVGIVVMVASLLSGFIERSGFPQVAVFLALGAAIGPFGLGMLNVGLDSQLLRTVATLSLALVLFTDAVKLDLNEVRRSLKLTGLIVGPGVILLAAALTVLAAVLLGLPWPAALIVGAALASTDPVLLRPLLNRRDVPADARLGLRLETGLDDIILLPIVLIAMQFLRTDSLSAEQIGKLLVNLFLLGPAAGILIGVVAIGAMDVVRKRIGIRRDYESLYSLGVALAAYAAAEAVHGSGFVAAFVAGLTISALDVELCDCFVEYGETTAELALLLTFVVLGSSLIWLGLPLAVGGPLVIGLPLVFAVIAPFVRPFIMTFSLLPAGIDAKSRRLIGWFGPSGLSSILIVLLPVFDGAPGSVQLFAICALAVLVSIVLHGGTLMFVRGDAPKRPKPERTPLERTLPARQGDLLPMASGGSARPADGAARPADGATRAEATRPAEPVLAAYEPTEDGMPGDDIRISIDGLRKIAGSGEPYILLDVRTDRSYGNSTTMASGALRLPPDHIVERARELDLDPNAWIVAYCT